MYFRTLVKLDVQRFYWFPFLKSNPTVLFPTPGSTFQPRDLKPANAPYTSVEASVSSRPTTTVGDCTVHELYTYSTCTVHSPIAESEFDAALSLNNSTWSLETVSLVSRIWIFAHYWRGIRVPSSAVTPWT